MLAGAADGAAGGARTSVSPATVTLDGAVSTTLYEPSGPSSAVPGLPTPRVTNPGAAEAFPGPSAEALPSVAVMFSVVSWASALPAAIARPRARPTAAILNLKRSCLTPVPSPRRSSPFGTALPGPDADPGHAPLYALERGGRRGGFGSVRAFAAPSSDEPRRRSPPTAADRNRVHRGDSPRFPTPGI